MSSSQFGPSAPPPQKSGGGSVLTIVLIVFGVLLLLCAGACGGCVYLTQSAVSSVAAQVELSPVMIASMLATQSDQQVIDKLGEPIEITASQMRTGSEAAYRQFHEKFFGRLLRYLLVITRGQEEAA